MRPPPHPLSHFCDDVFSFNFFFLCVLVHINRHLHAAIYSARDNVCNSIGELVDSKPEYCWKQAHILSNPFYWFHVSKL